MFLLKPLVVDDYKQGDPTASCRWAGLSLRNNWSKFKTSGKSLDLFRRIYKRYLKLMRRTGRNKTSPVGLGNTLLSTGFFQILLGYWSRDGRVETVEGSLNPKLIRWLHPTSYHCKPSCSCASIEYRVDISWAFSVRFALNRAVHVALTIYSVPRVANRVLWRLCRKSLRESPARWGSVEESLRLFLHSWANNILPYLHDQFSKNKSFCEVPKYVINTRPHCPKLINILL